MKVRFLIALLSGGLFQTLPLAAADEEPAESLPLPQRGERGEEWQLRVQKNNTFAHQAAAQINLVFDGDSITDFWRDKGEAVWNQHYAKLGAYDFGISGDRTENVLWRIGQGQLQGLKPKLVALMIGSNDVETAESPANIANRVKQIVTAYREECPDAVILLEAILPLGEYPDNPLRAKTAATNELISKLADGTQVRYLDFGDRFVNPDGSLSREAVGDLVHPSEKGYQIWAEALQPVVSEFFPDNESGLRASE